MNIIRYMVLVLLVATLAACQNPIAMHTTVHEDGTLDKTITLEKADSSRTVENMFGINAANGWEVVARQLPDSMQDKNTKSQYAITFTRTFPSADAVNAALDQKADTLFQVHTRFDKQFRWFFTYLRYSETIRPINRFKQVLASDFFTREDSAFVKRLPAEGKPISRADSLQLDMLNDKISDHFVNRAIFEEEYAIMKAIVGKYLEPRWLDTLRKKRDVIFTKIDKNKGEPTLAQEIADTLGLPLPHPQADTDFAALSKDLNSRVSFMSFAQDGRYTNSIEVPWTITNTNADSVAGRQVFWKPIVNKFVFQDYEMVVECRKMNLWAVLTTLVLLGGAGWSWWRKR